MASDQSEQVSNSRKHTAKKRLKVHSFDMCSTIIAQGKAGYTDNRSSINVDFYFTYGIAPRQNSRWQINKIMGT
jgi:hypothetical protein